MVLRPALPELALILDGLNAIWHSSNGIPISEKDSSSQVEFIPARIM